NRPQRMNALNDALAAELATALAEFDADPGIGAIIVTGSDKAFAAGADIGAMAEWDYQKVYADNYIMAWESVKHTRKPVIAAVAGYALGGGCELAMMCDMIIAADNAKFGQPEITIGTMPGMGGTQRLPRAVGKGKAMDWCLTGRMIDAAEAERAGRVAGISGIVGAMLRPQAHDFAWRAAFVAGLLLAPVLYAALATAPTITIAASYPVLIVAGLLVGIGTRFAGGCTSGHAVCGLS